MINRIKRLRGLLLWVLLLFSWELSSAQTIKILTSGEKTSIRGLSVVSDKIIWVSGSNGKVGRTLDGGETWKWNNVKGFEKIDFRDIEAFDASTAIIMGITEPAYILKTTDGGESWRVVYENKTKGMFLDAMDFRDEQNGIVLGDPINNKFFIATTVDGGNSWQDFSKNNAPLADSGEACFASSGTNIRMFDRDEVCFITGGLRSRIFIGNNIFDLPILQGKETTGANSIASKNKKRLIVVGGDFNASASINKNCFITKDGGKTWTAPSLGPNGYRSCVEYVGKKNWVTCGLNGVDYSSDEGKTWKWISKESFHVVRKAKTGKAIYFAGINGKIGKLQPL